GKPKYDTAEAERILVRAARASGVPKSFATVAGCEELLQEFQTLAESIGFDVHDTQGGGFHVRAGGKDVEVGYTRGGEITVSGAGGAFEKPALVWNPLTSKFQDADSPTDDDQRSPLAVLAEAVVRRLAK